MDAHLTDKNLYLITALKTYSLQMIQYGLSDHTRDRIEIVNGMINLRKVKWRNSCPQIYLPMI